MAEIKIVIENGEIQEMKEVKKVIGELKRNELLKFKGFLEGLEFVSESNNV